jgi:peptidoglycan/xylan/chitin deacetylase (PgdA/CDA1 family)/SAM-dependent methyltransferase
MASRTSVIVTADVGGRGLVRTADSVARQGATDELFVAVSGQSVPARAASLTARHGARWVHSSTTGIGDAVNEAARRGSRPYLAIVPAGYVLPGRFLDCCESTLDADERLQALIPSVILQTADGRGRMLWQSEALDVAPALTDPLGISPVLFLRQSLWRILGGMDRTLSCLVEFEWWLRVLIAQHPVQRLPDPPVLRDIDGVTGAKVSEESYRSALGGILTMHRDAIEDRLTAVLAGQEVRFGRLRDQHTELVARRDVDLAELDRLRAESAHHRAYLDHHGRSGLDWGDFRRIDPISRNWGYDRGVPIDRRYIEQFLAGHSSDIRGAVLEVQEDDFTRRFGGPRVATSAVLDIDGSNARATVVTDLRAAPDLPSSHVDCVILTQTLHVIDDMPAVVRECHRVLKPGGVLLATLPAASRVCLEYGQDGDLWRMPPAGARAVIGSAFSAEQVDCDVYGNVLTNVAFLHGLACTDLTDAEFDAVDPYFPALTGVRARRAPSGSAVRAARPARGVVLLYHRIDPWSDIHKLGVSPEIFESHLKWLNAECHVVPLEALLSTPPESLTERAIAVTFDDGYLDNLREAAPRLQRVGVPATFFMTSRWLEETGEYWWDALERILLDQPVVPPVLDGFGDPMSTSTVEERRAAHWRLHGMLVHARLDERDRAMATLQAWGGGGTARVRPMHADDLRELARFPWVTIGAHTVNHLSLPDQPADVRERELHECRISLARVLGRTVDLCAYPYGAVDRQVAGLVRGSWRWGLSCDERMLAESFDAARVPRLEVKSWSVEDLASRVDRLFRPPPPSVTRAATLLP